ncbi:MAG: ABC transporter substrate-binding protein [Desulfovibrio sp.]|nr:MAG: ABC transporter substrate-binding protein [Desulfovibrio sp.]
MKKWFSAFLVGLAVLAICVAPAMAEDTVKVGIILPLTGSQASFGEIEKNSFDMALAEINAAGGINGTPLEFIYEDDTGRPEVGSSAAEKLITQDQVVMLGGGYSSSVCANIASTAESNAMPFLINTGSADNITEHGYQYVFRLNPPASEYPKATESFLQDVVQPETCAILFENSNFGTSSSDKFKALCERLGIEVVLFEAYEHGAVDFKPLLIKVKAANPDIIYMVSYVMDASLIMKQSVQLQITPQAFIGGGAGFTLPEFQENAGSASEKVFSATLWYQTLPYEGAQEYYDKYMEQFGAPTEYHGAEAYAAAYVIADVLTRTASFSNDDIRTALSETNMETVFGHVEFISYDEKTNQNSVPTYMVQWIDGKLELVWPEDVQSAPYVYPIDWAAERQ